MNLHWGGWGDRDPKSAQTGEAYLPRILSVLLVPKVEFCFAIEVSDSNSEIHYCLNRYLIQLTR